ncbi:MAG: helix-turn-helix transcriptional regulator [Eubacteriales bacterium]|jgi:predicted DNA-binding transcriptional regulator YafY
MKDNGKQRLKLLVMMEMLSRSSDENNPKTTSELINYLNEQGISCDRRTLAKDIALLNSSGYEIMHTFVGHEKGYYISERNFSIPELKILIDAVRAAGFITEKKTQILAEKIAFLEGENQGNLLTSKPIWYFTHKHNNEQIYYNVDSLEEAIQQNCRAEFLYFDLDEHRERVFRKNGEVYNVEPLSLVYSENYYYLICYSSKYKELCNYRVDRMERVVKTDEPISAEAFEAEKKIAEYTESVFNMYNVSKATKVTLEFDRKILNAVYDKFGEDTKVSVLKDDLLSVDVNVRISPTFWGWLFTFGDQMTIAAPQEAVDEYKKRLKQTLKRLGK